MIAYLHVVLLGFTSFFLFGWMIQKKIIPAAVRTSTRLLAAGFILSEILLAILPWSERFVHEITIPLLKVILVLSVLMAASIATMTVKAYRLRS
ncbi:hypothetical protein WBG78_09320 [Chryseolinea sp. T2]|uniref:hypothetical protein n=1 Tax=Chryseolinea sp. T2 TaxID=3129255 RepID=UPI0030768902